jgi:hypothetical protein
MRNRSLMNNRAPEPSEADIARASVAKAREVFDASDGRLTVAYYRRLSSVAKLGCVAMNLFRAQKTSSRAKKYRGRRYRDASYDVKNYSLTCLVTALGECPEIKWGWSRDDGTPGFEWVLYVDLPQIDTAPPKQASFHSAVRLAGPDYLEAWDGKHESEERILEFCDVILAVDVLQHKYL